VPEAFEVLCRYLNAKDPKGFGRGVWRGISVIHAEGGRHAGGDWPPPPAPWGSLWMGFRGDEFISHERERREATQEVLGKGRAMGKPPHPAPGFWMAERRSSASWGAEFYLFFPPAAKLAPCHRPAQ
jgi:hypothetical protein